ncbi:hypothetical protein D770_22310 [Flammeovirgaceae bacterium 311]|nr:hypothetical protein D770_22310 [Flammeovirgaceae bacterium 311]
MLVNQHTKIAVLLEHHPQALETIVSLNPRFEKLRNPLLRRLMAGRTSIGMAASIAGCAEDDFFRVLRPLGFETAHKKQESGNPKKQMPHVLQSIEKEQVVSLNVRPVLEDGNDPLKEILATVKALKQGEVLKIINTFEPTPLIVMLQRKGFKHWTHTIHHQYIETWFYRETEEQVADLTALVSASKEDWQSVRARYADRLTEIDVRALEMPQPMILILESLESLPEKHALYVVHKRIPVFLLPELAQRNFDYRSRELSEDEVHLIIFRN